MNTYMTHSRSNRLATLMRAALAVLALGLTLGGCASDSHTAQGAARGAGSGAVAGAVGGLVGALVFGGDVGGSMARGAVVGAAVGGTAGAISGSERDKRAEQARQAELDRLRNEIGQDAFDGLAALAECKHDVSLRQAAKAQQSSNPDYVLAGLWLEVLSHADQRDEPKARSLFPRLIEQDRDIKTEAQAEETMRNALNTLMDIRQEYKLPRVC
jgi:hypothetical protein